VIVSGRDSGAVAAMMDLRTSGVLLMSVKRRVRLGTLKLRTVKENIVNGEQGLVQNNWKATVDL